ncbi:hypothetical protein EES39_13760 [Streptomyces sp. ADI92-24]|nr:hypothetical protein EES39_13760 [Streptomyces sp. ADI92-24]
MPVLPAWLTDPLWDQFAALLPERPAVDPAQPLVSAVGLAADLVELGEIVVGQRESRAGGVLAQVCHR